MSGRKRLIVTAVGEPLEARAKAALYSAVNANPNLRSGSCLTGDGGGWEWRLEEASEGEGSIDPKSKSIDDLATDYAVAMRESKKQVVPLVHLWVEGAISCGFKDGSGVERTGAVHSVTCIPCLRKRIFRERELLWHAENDGNPVLVQDAAEARGARRNQFQKLIGQLELASTEASVLYFTAKMAPSESKRESKAHDRWLKAKDRTDRLREKLLALACPDMQADNAE